MVSKGTGPLALLSPEDTDIFIKLIHSHEAVWDVRHANYRNMEVKKAQWRSIQESFTQKTGIACTEGNVCTKYTSLRNNFTRELRLVRDSLTSGQETEKARKPTWQFFSALEFLRDVITINPVPTPLSSYRELGQTSSTSSPSLGQARTHSEPLKTEHNKEDDFSNCELILEAFSPDESDNSTDVPHSTQAGVVRHQSTPSTRPAKGRKRKASRMTPMQSSPVRASLEGVDRKDKKEDLRSLDPWLINVRDNMLSLKKRRRTLLKIAIDNMINENIIEQLNSDSE